MTRQGWNLCCLQLVPSSMAHKDDINVWLSGDFSSVPRWALEVQTSRLKEIMEFVCGDKLFNTSSLGSYLEYHIDSSSSSVSSMHDEIREGYALSVWHDDVQCGWFWVWWIQGGLCPLCSLERWLQQCCYQLKNVVSHDTDPEGNFYIENAFAGFYKISPSDARNLGIMLLGACLCALTNHQKNV